jgi:hypothetical protein
LAAAASSNTTVAWGCSCNAEAGTVSAAVRIAAAGDALLALSVTMRLIDAFARRPAQTLPAPSRLASLTVPERDILLRLAARAAGPGAGCDPGLRDRHRAPG